MSIYLYDDDVPVQVAGRMGIPAGDLTMRYWDTGQSRFVVLPVPVEDWEVDAMHYHAMM